MRINVVGKNLEVTDAIRQYAETKVDRLTKYFDGVQQINVTLTGANGHGTNEFGVEFVVDVEKHADFVSHVSDKDLYAGIDRAMEKAERQLRDFKEKLKLGKH
ncbi:MAG TPA: ribosome-associated translation inhibitor RaiA [Phycisphaerales bacterium]|nr:ribosome-associated translation inhibitor RaiA [Phycisphaerales bacterium]